MIAIDTNIVVRFLTQDDEQQYRKSLKLFREQELFISDTVILETEWVLRFAYEFNHKQISDAFKNLFGLPNVQLANERLIEEVLRWYDNGLDFADAMHLSQSQQCIVFYTFDNKFIKKAKGLTECKVQQP